MVGPLSSMAPRAYSLPSRMSGEKGGVVHPSPGGTTSTWPRMPINSSPSPYSTCPAYPSRFFVSKPSRRARSSRYSSASATPLPKGAPGPAEDSSSTLSMARNSLVRASSSSRRFSISRSQSMLIIVTPHFRSLAYVVLPETRNREASVHSVKRHPRRLRENGSADATAIRKAFEVDVKRRREICQKTFSHGKDGGTTACP